MRSRTILGVCGLLVSLRLLHQPEASAQAEPARPATHTSPPSPDPDVASESSKGQPAVEVSKDSGATLAPAPPTVQFETPAANSSSHGHPRSTPASVNPDANAPPALTAQATTAAQATPAPGRMAREHKESSTDLGLAFDLSRTAINAPRQEDPFEFRQREMPGDYVARPVTLPEGTFELTLNNYVAFIDAAEVVGWVPSFALGITSSFELGMSAPLRYNETLQDWTELDPLVHLSQQWLDEPELESAIRIAALIPATSMSATQFELGAPFLWHASRTVRVDASVNAVVALEKATQVAANVPLGVTVQPTSWLYTGVSATPNFGLTKERQFGLDAGARLGLTLQARGSAQVDIVATMFAENIGNGRDGKTTDGIGTVFTGVFYPEVY
jgi:hypothetical protein